jgi:REP element-mobilizing transposase RayT
MARPMRIEYEGAFYHVTSRGNERKEIFRVKEDYERFKHYISEAQDKYDFLLHGYVLMTNHYHLILETNKANLHQIMHYLNGSYTTYFNRSNGRSGHLFQGRYKGVVIDVDNYLLELSRYLHLNPVRAGMVKRPEEYAHSSYRSYIGLGKKKEGIVTRDRIWGMISGGRRRATQKYRRYVEEGMKKESRNPLKNLYGGAILGSGEFVQELLRSKGPKKVKDEEISYRRQFKATKKIEDVIVDLSSYFDVQPSKVLEEKGVMRDIGIYFGKKYTGLTNREIGERFGGLSYSGVTRVSQRFKEKLAKNMTLRRRVEEIDETISNVKG